jgi:hypothetical protein
VRRFFLILVIAMIGFVIIAIVGPSLPEDNFINGIGTGIRNVVGGIGESIGVSMRGFAG